ncbi:MAG: hypothetical protein WKG07_16295 [Hymenobacter sp.]
MPTNLSPDAPSRKPAVSRSQLLLAPIKRRSFFLYAGATAGATALVLAGLQRRQAIPFAVWHHRCGHGRHWGPQLRLRA